MPGFASLCVSRETYMRTQELPVANTWTRGLLQVEVAVKEAGRVRDAHPCISYLPHVCPPSPPPPPPPSPLPPPRGVAPPPPPPPPPPP
eukprot:COSAG01_NODE_31644_length_594_cov_0.509091_1_plen_88_part_10